MTDTARFVVVENGLAGVDSLRTLLHGMRPRPALDCATGLDDGFELLRHSPASALFLDLTLLGERAAEQIRGLRKLRPAMPILGLANDPDLAARARRAQWVDESVLLGQLSGPVLSMALRHAARQNRLRRELAKTRHALREAEARAAGPQEGAGADRRTEAAAPIVIDEGLAQAQKMEALGQLTGGLAHDFNNLLTVIIGNLHLIHRAVGDDERLARQASAALDAASRGAKLTRQMLAVARRQPLEPQALDLAAHLAEFTEILYRTLGGAIDVDIRVRPDAWMAMADPSLLESAVLNLAINARDAMPDGGRLRITVENRTIDERDAARAAEPSPGDYVCLSVEDDGAGMDAATLARVAEPFFTTKAPGSGTGLGLSIVHAFAAQSGGHLELQSEPGKGTTATIYLPKASASEVDLTSKTLTRLSAVPAGNEHILLVEDDGQVREMAAEMLRNLGYAVREAGDAAAALAELENDAAVDLLFTDIVMPGKIDGLQLGRTVNRRYPAMKVLYTSGYVGESAGKATARLAQPLLGKPYRINELAAKVREVLDQPAQA